jgi:hypothetical protein
MIEKEMGYRGSKSITSILTSQNKLVIVKEQRVDGSYISRSEVLRCTLMGFKRNFQKKILSNQIIKTSFSTFSKTYIKQWCYTQ